MPILKNLVLGTRSLLLLPSHPRRLPSELLGWPSHMTSKEGPGFSSGATVSTVGVHGFGELGHDHLGVKVVAAAAAVEIINLSAGMACMQSSCGYHCSLL